MPRYYTIGAVAANVQSFKELSERLKGIDPAPDSTVALVRRGDERLARLLLPEARIESVQSGLTKMQWFELVSTFFSASTVSFLMGAVHLPTGLVVQVLLTLAFIVGLLVYRRRLLVKKMLLGFGMPEKLAGEWEVAFAAGFALLLAIVPVEGFDEVQNAFLEGDAILSPLAVDRRIVL